MNSAKQNTDVKPVPEGMHTVTPHLVCDGAADAIAFYEKAFGAVEQMRMPGPNGRLMHGCIKIGDSQVMLVDANSACGIQGPKELSGSPVTLHLQVEDADALIEQAVAAGATLKMPVTDMFWGDRYGQVEDPFGHCWAIATHVRDLSLEEIQEGMQAMFSQG
ncbi:hypothetical protein Mal35_14190 [Gimesia maris]|uniref:VOC family protein n=1 Tax=Gimesia maris TaxID=122 RepID=UPI001188EBCC|nr:VOC family protein [Gimesia maris]QDT77989.1 hypothetical protein Mal35_14190 [Gimesia maris]